MKSAYSSLVRRLHDTHPYEEDVDKLNKRVPQHVLGTKMMAQGEELGESALFGNAFVKCGRLQLDQGTLLLQHHRSVNERVCRPLQQILDGDFPALLNERRKVLNAQAGFAVVGLIDV